MFGKKFLRSSSGVVLSASLISTAQNTGVFADEETKLALESSVEESVDFLEAEKKGDSVVGDTFNNANCVGKAKEEEPQVTKFEDLGTSPVSENNENSDGLGEKSAIGGDAADSVDPTVEQDNKQVNLPENSNILQVENGVENNEKVLDKEQLLKKKLKELEERQGENSQKIEGLKKMYEEEMKKLNLEGKNLVTEVNKIKDELGIKRDLTREEIPAAVIAGIWRFLEVSGDLFSDLYYFLLMLALPLYVTILILQVFCNMSYSQASDTVVEFLLKQLKKVARLFVNSGRVVKDKFVEGFMAAKNFCVNLRVPFGYERLASHEN